MPHARAYSDASNIALGVVYGHSWSYIKFKGRFFWLTDTPIVFKEMYAAVYCIAVFGPRMSNTFIKMYTDNTAVYSCINSGTSKDNQLMGLLRALYFYTTKYCIHYRAYWLSTVDNECSDSISRLQFDRFRKLCPLADTDPTPVIDIVTDFV